MMEQAATPTEEDVAQLAAGVETIWQELVEIERQLSATTIRRKKLAGELARTSEAKKREPLRIERGELDEEIEVLPIKEREARMRLQAAFEAYTRAQQARAHERLKRLREGRIAFVDYLTVLQEHKRSIDALELRAGTDRTRSGSAWERASAATPETIVDVVRNYFPFRLIPEAEIAEALQIPGIEAAVA